MLYKRKNLLFLWCAFLLLLLLVLSNPTENWLNGRISQNHQFITLRMIRDSHPTTYLNGLYYRRFMDISRKNHFFFSIYHIHYGWYGNMRPDGSVIDYSKITDGNNYYYNKSEETMLGIMGVFVPLSNNEILNFKP